MQDFYCATTEPSLFLFFVAAKPTKRACTAIYCMQHVKQWHRPPGLNHYRWCEQRSEKSNKENNCLLRPGVSRLFKESAAVFMCLPDITPPFENGLCNKRVCSTAALCYRVKKELAMKAVRDLFEIHWCFLAIYVFKPQLGCLESATLHQHSMVKVLVCTFSLQLQQQLSL